MCRTRPSTYSSLARSQAGSPGAGCGVRGSSPALRTSQAPPGFRVGGSRPTHAPHPSRPGRRCFCLQLRPRGGRLPRRLSQRGGRQEGPGRAVPTASPRAAGRQARPGARGRTPRVGPAEPQTQRRGSRPREESRGAPESERPSPVWLLLQPKRPLPHWGSGTRT